MPNRLILITQELDQARREMLADMLPDWKMVIGKQQAVWENHLADAEIIVGWKKGMEHLTSKHKMDSILERRCQQPPLKGTGSKRNPSHYSQRCTCVSHLRNNHWTDACFNEKNSYICEESTEAEMAP